MIATPETSRSCSDGVMGHRYCQQVRHLWDTSSGSALPCLVLRCLYRSGLWQTTCVMATRLVTHWGQWPCGHFAGMHHTVLGGRVTMNGTCGLLKGNGAPIQNNRISLVIFQERQIPRKYHNFGQWLPTSILFIKNHLRYFCKENCLMHPPLERTVTAV